MSGAVGGYYGRRAARDKFTRNIMAARINICSVSPIRRGWEHANYFQTVRDGPEQFSPSLFPECDAPIFNSQRQCAIGFRADDDECDAGGNLLHNQRSVQPRICLRCIQFSGGVAVHTAQLIRTAPDPITADLRALVV